MAMGMSCEDTPGAISTHEQILDRIEILMVANGETW